MELRLLKIFRDVAYELSFVRAARINRLTQPSVSGYIKQLESQLNTKLFERAPNSVTLTPEGKLLLPHAEEVLRSADSLAMAAGEIKDSPKGEIRIASIHSIGMYEIGDTLRKFMLRYPAIHVHLQYRQAADIYDLVLNKQVELGLVAYPEKRANIETLIYGSDKLVVIMPRGHRLCSHKRLNLEQLANEDFVAFDEGTPTREAIDALLRKHKTSVRMRMTNDNIFALKKAVEIGIGISIVPESTIEEECRAGVIVKTPIVGAAATRQLALIYLKRRPLSKGALLFLELLGES